MGPAIYILAILGCGEDQTACQTVAVMPTQYQTAAACDAGIDAVAQRPIAVDYPVMVAQCLRMDAAAAAVLKGSDVQLPPAEKPAPVKRATYRPGQSARG
jgi:hypothetical protein